MKKIQKGKQETAGKRREGKQKETEKGTKGTSKTRKERNERQKEIRERYFLQPTDYHTWVVS